MKKASHWVTLPDEDQKKSSIQLMKMKLKAILGNLKHRIKRTFRQKVKKDNLFTKKANVQTEVVDHKFFWGVGFLFILVFTTALLAPNHLSRLMEGNLFEALDSVELIPEDDTEQEGLSLIPPFEEQGFSNNETSDEFSSSVTEGSNQSNAASGSEGGVEPQVNPVEVQVDPVDIPSEPVEDSSTESESNETGNEPQTEDTNAIESEEETLNPAAGDLPESNEQAPEAEEQSSEEETPQADDEEDQNALLLEELARQLETLREENQRLEALNESAPDESVGSNSINTNDQIAETPNQVLNQFFPSATNTNELAQTNAPETSRLFRENTHKVTRSPDQILADFNQQYNQATQAQIANLAGAETEENSLNQVPSTPTTGPIEGLLPAILFTILAVFIWICGRVFFKA